MAKNKKSSVYQEIAEEMKDLVSNQNDMARDYGGNSIIEDSVEQYQLEKSQELNKIQEIYELTKRGRYIAAEKAITELKEMIRDKAPQLPEEKDKAVFAAFNDGSEELNDLARAYGSNSMMKEDSFQHYQLEKVRKLANEVLHRDHDQIIKTALRENRIKDASHLHQEDPTIFAAIQQAGNFLPGEQQELQKDVEHIASTCGPHKKLVFFSFKDVTSDGIDTQWKLVQPEDQLILYHGLWIRIEEYYKVSKYRLDRDALATSFDVKPEYSAEELIDIHNSMDLYLLPYEARDARLALGILSGIVGKTDTAETLKKTEETFSAALQKEQDRLVFAALNNGSEALDELRKDCEHIASTCGPQEKLAFFRFKDGSFHNYWLVQPKDLLILDRTEWIRIEEFYKRLSVRLDRELVPLQFIVKPEYSSTELAYIYNSMELYLQPSQIEIARSTLGKLSQPRTQVEPTSEVVGKTDAAELAAFVDQLIEDTKRFTHLSVEDKQQRINAFRGWTLDEARAAKKMVDESYPSYHDVSMSVKPESALFSAAVATVGDSSPYATKEEIEDVIAQIKESSERRFIIFYDLVNIDTNQKGSDVYIKDPLLNTVLNDDGTWLSIEKIELSKEYSIGHEYFKFYLDIDPLSEAGQRQAGVATALIASLPIANKDKLDEGITNLWNETRKQQLTQAVFDNDPLRQNPFSIPVVTSMEYSPMPTSVIEQAQGYIKETQTSLDEMHKILDDFNNDMDQTSKYQGQFQDIMDSKVAAMRLLAERLEGLKDAKEAAPPVVNYDNVFRAIITANYNKDFEEWMIQQPEVKSMIEYAKASHADAQAFQSSILTRAEQLLQDFNNRNSKVVNDGNWDATTMPADGVVLTPNPICKDTIAAPEPSIKKESKVMGKINQSDALRDVFLAVIRDSAKEYTPAELAKEIERHIPHLPDGHPYKDLLGPLRQQLEQGNDTIANLILKEALTTRQREIKKALAQATTSDDVETVIEEAISASGGSTLLTDMLKIGGGAIGAVALQQLVQAAQNGSLQAGVKKLVSPAVNLVAGNKATPEAIQDLQFEELDGEQARMSGQEIDIDISISD